MSKKLSKKTMGIIVGGVIILVLAAAAAVLLLNPPDTGAGASSDSMAVSLIDENSNDVTSVKVKNDKDEFTIVSAGEDVWQIPEIADYPPVSSKYTSVNMAVSSLTATQVVAENVTDLSEYGFDQPSLSFEVDFNNGHHYAFTQGAVSPDGIYRYLIKTGENTVYAISQTALSALDASRYDFLDKTILPSYTDQDGNQAPPTVELYRVTRPDMEKPLTLEALESGKLGSGSTKTGAMELTSPVNAMASDDRVPNYVYNLFGLTASSIVKTAPTPEELTQYGFDQPSCVLELQYNETFHATLRTGYGLDANGAVTQNPEDIVSYYLIKDGTDMVYTVSKTSASWMIVEPKDVLSKLLTLPYVGDVDKVEISTGGQTSVLDITATPSAQSGSKNDEISFTLDGKAVPEADGKSFYSLLLSTEAQDVYLGDVTGEPVLRYTYKMRNGSDQSIEIYRDADLATILVLNGKDKFIGRSGYVEKIQKELDNLKTGKPVSDEW